MTPLPSIQSEAFIEKELHGSSAIAPEGRAGVEGQDQAQASQGPQQHRRRRRQHRPHAHHQADGHAVDGIRELEEQHTGHQAFGEHADQASRDGASSSNKPRHPRPHSGQQQGQDAHDDRHPPGRSRPVRSIRNQGPPSPQLLNQAGHHPEHSSSVPGPGVVHDNSTAGVQAPRSPDARADVSAQVQWQFKSRGQEQFNACASSGPASNASKTSSDARQKGRLYADSKFDHPADSP